MSLTKQVHRSILKKIVATEILQERENCNFDQAELTSWYHDKATQERYNADLELMKNTPGFGNTHKFYEYTA